MGALVQCVVLAILGLTLTEGLMETAKQDINVFPSGFLFGTATASYQIEGAWNVSGKGENIWDHFTHTQPFKIADGSNGDIATDSYNKYKEDVLILKTMGMHVYRFSMSWSRILPTGIVGTINEAGVDYYNNLINELLANGIQPMVTIYHWDLPQHLQDLGGWTNPILVSFYEDYARLLFTKFGDRVKWWITFNEPLETCKGYSETLTAPGLGLEGEGDYFAAHTILKSHARAYHIYNDEFRQTQQGKVTITLNSDWVEPLTNSTEDQEAAYNSLMFNLGWFAHPIYSNEGNYPPIMRERIARNSLAEGRTESRLPEFDSYWIEYIKGTADFFALNHYTSRLAEMGLAGPNPSRGRDSGVLTSIDPSWPGSASSWLKVVPWGFRKLLQFISMEYNNPAIFVTENGFSDRGELNDTNRTNYYTSYLSELLKAYYLDGANVIGYTAWSLLDNFEWALGYTEKFGLYYVDFNDPARPRTPKNSSYVFSEIARSGRLPAGNSDIPIKVSPVSVLQV